MYKEKIVNLETGEEIWRDFSEAEIEAIEKAKSQALIEIEKYNEIIEAKNQVLKKLGITEEEAKLLLS